MVGIEGTSQRVNEPKKRVNESTSQRANEKSGEKRENTLRFRSLLRRTSLLALARSLSRSPHQSFWRWPISRILSPVAGGVAIPLGPPSPAASCGLPGGPGRASLGAPPYLALLRKGFSVPSPLPEKRWALTPPFHPYRPRPKARQAVPFLWHSPSDRSALPLAGLPPCGVRTFLCGLRSGHPATSIATLQRQYLDVNGLNIALTGPGPGDSLMPSG